VRTGKPIVYTSADSVFQVAAHEDVIPVPELYRICDIAFELVALGHGVGRVIARPFVGTPGAFQRTANRRDFALTPFAPTLLDRVKDSGRPVIAIGKIEDLFAGRGITSAVHTTSDNHGMDEIERAMEETASGLIFANLVDFDTVYGHRNVPAGYAQNLERFDARLAGLLPRLRGDDLLIVTADHGNDPTTPSTDHSREHVPVLLHGTMVRWGVDVGVRPTFADLGQTVAEIFGVGPLEHGTSFWREIGPRAAG
jgi:phosphopentomutase